MADGSEVCIFSFADVSEVAEKNVLTEGVFRANSPAPNGENDGV